MNTRLFIAILAVFVLLAVGWVGYWNYVAGQAEQRLRAWASAQSEQGAEVSLGRIVRHGFPVLLRLEMRDINYAAARGGWRAQTDRADLHVDMLNPQHVILRAEAPIAVSRSNGAVTNISAEALIASLRTDGGRLAVAGIEANDLVLDDPAQEGSLTMRRGVVSARPDARAAGEYQLAIETQGLQLPRPVRSFETFGLDVETLRAAIVVTHGADLLETSPQDPLGPWRVAGGQLRFEALELRWGPLESTATGEGGLDDQRRIVGRLVVPVDRPAPVLTAIANGPSVNDDARRALGLLAAGYLVTGDDITLDAVADDGILRVEGLPVRPLPPVY
jgi:hypothetical protein